MWDHYFLIKPVLCRVRPAKASSPGARLTSTQAASPREVGSKPAALQTHTQFCRREEAAVGARQDGNHHFNEIGETQPHAPAGRSATRQVARLLQNWEEQKGPLEKCHPAIKYGLIWILTQADGEEIIGRW